MDFSRKLSFVAIILMMVLISSSSYLPVMCQTSDEEWASADSLFKQEKYDSALQAYTKIISQNPKNAKAYEKFGTTLATMERYEDAITAYEYALKLDPTRKNLYKLLAVLYTKTNQPLKAKQIAREISSSAELNEPSELLSRIKSVIQLQKQGSSSEALTEVNKIISDYPDSREAYMRKSGVLYSMKKYGPALKVAMHAHKLKPDSRTYHVLGLIYEKQSDINKAKDAYLSALKLDEENCVNYYALARLYRQEGNLSQSSVMSEEGCKRDPFFPPLDFKSSPSVQVKTDRTKTLDLKSTGNSKAIQFNNYGIQLGSKGYWPEAIANHQKACELEPYNIYFRRNLSSANLQYAVQLKNQGENEKAIVRFKEALKADYSNQAARQKLKELEQ